MDIGAKIKELRVLNGLTQEELADRSELSKGFISQLENDLTSPSISTLEDILQCLGITISEFFAKEEEPVQVVFGEEDFKALGVDVTVTTADGSYGIKGFVTDALPEYDYYYFTCGPEPMLKAVYKNAKGDGQFSFEERMGCGFGACMGCSHKTVKGYKRVCKDGPVFKKEEILWED